MLTPVGVSPDMKLSGQCTHYNRQWHATMCHSHLYNDTLVIHNIHQHRSMAFEGLGNTIIDGNLMPKESLTIQ